MKKNSFVIVLIISFLTVSCHIKPSGVLSEKKMEKVLFEIHKTEGALQAQGLDYTSSWQKKQYQHLILKKYNVTEADFDSSLVWYTKHPKEFALVYNKVLARLDTLNSQVQKGKFHPQTMDNSYQETNLWNLASSYKFTKDSAFTKIDFEIPTTDNLMVGDRYILSFLRRVGASDSSINPHIVMIVNYLNGKKDSIYTKTYNDSLLRRYKLEFKARDTLKIKSISGSLLGSRGSKGKMDAMLDSIKLIRRFNAYDQIKLRERVNTKDKTLPPVQ